MPTHPFRSHAKRTASLDAKQLRSHRAKLLRIVIALVSLSAFAAFAIQAWFAYGFAREVWKLPTVLSFAVPVANDLFIVTLMVVSFLLREAEARVRVYVWCVLGLGIASQIGAAWSFEQWRSHGSHYGVSVAALVPAGLLAASLHSLIIAARHIGPTDGQGRETGQAVADAALRRAHTQFERATAAQQAAGRAPVTAVPARPDRAPAAPPVSSGRGSVHPDRDLAVKRRLAGESAKAIAADLGVTARAVQGWVKAHHRTQRHSGSSAMQGAEIAAPGALFPKGFGLSGGEMHPGVADTEP
jgi:hypothetical protein